MFLFTISYGIILLLVTVFSYGLVDGNFPIIPFRFLFEFIHANPFLAGMLYSVLLIILFVMYVLLLSFLKKGKAKKEDIWKLIAISIVILLFSFPGISTDIFNYIASAKVTFFYHENPYVIMPIEIPNEPMLVFMHAANKVALYGPIWIILTVIPHVLGFGNLYLTIFLFKLFVALFYVALIRLIWQATNKNIWQLTLFALNPLVLTETLIAGHNDVVMMFFALASFILLKRNKIVLSVVSLICSILIKYATILLLPIYIAVIFCLITKRKMSWETVWYWSAVAMFIAFILSPIREEIYAWYFIWPLVFVSLLNKNDFLKIISFGFSFGLMFRFVPFLVTGSWAGITPLIKKVVTFTPPVITATLYAIKKKS